MAVSLKDKKLLVLDWGLFTAAAVRCAEEFGEVMLCRPDEGGFPRLNEGMVGAGMPGIKLVHNPWKWAHKVDMVACFDLYFGDFAQECVRQNIPTWGALRGEDLEIERTATQKEQQKRGLPTPEFYRVVGVKAVREFLKGHKGIWWIKAERWRGVRESFKAESLEAVEPILRRIESEQGPLAEDLPFLVTADLPDRVEFGMDTYIVKGEHPAIGCGGYEIKDCGYIGVAQPWEKFPEPVTRWFKAMQPVLASYGYRGWLSTECRVGKDGKPYYNDITTRMPAPPFEAMIKMKNFPQVVWSVAHGQMLDPDFPAKYCAAVIIKTSSPDDFQRVIVPKEDRDSVVVRYPCLREGMIQSIPQTVAVSETATAVAWGGSVREVIQRAEDIAKRVKGCDLHPCEDAMRKGLDAIEEGKRYGLSIF